MVQGQPKLKCAYGSKSSGSFPCRSLANARRDFQGDDTLAPVPYFGEFSACSTLTPRFGTQLPSMLAVGNNRKMLQSQTFSSRFMVFARERKGKLYTNTFGWFALHVLRAGGFDSINLPGTVPPLPWNPPVDSLNWNMAKENPNLQSPFAETCHFVRSYTDILNIGANHLPTGTKWILPMVVFLLVPLSTKPISAHTPFCPLTWNLPGGPLEENSSQVPSSLDGRLWAPAPWTHRTDPLGSRLRLRRGAAAQAVELLVEPQREPRAREALGGAFRMSGGQAPSVVSRSPCQKTRRYTLPPLFAWNLTLTGGFWKTNRLIRPF